MNKGIFFVVGGIMLLLGGGVFFVVRGKGGSQTYTGQVTIVQAEPVEESAPQPVMPPADVVKGVPKKLDVSVKEKEADPLTPSTPSTGSGQASSGQAGSGQAPEISKVETASHESMFKITDRLIDFGFAVPKKVRGIDTVVLHSSYNALGGDYFAVSKLIDEYREYGVSAHYLVDREGGVYRLVKDENIAYHAGTSKMPDGRTNVNDFSVGIELMNTMEGRYTDKQYEAVNGLLAYLKKEYPIRHVVGHSDIAPGRKTDPWNFDWKRLE